jgi:hypothetical protein
MEQIRSVTSVLHLIFSRGSLYFPKCLESRTGELPLPEQSMIDVSQGPHPHPHRPQLSDGRVEDASIDNFLSPMDSNVANMLQTDPAGRVVGLRVPASWVGS